MLKNCILSLTLMSLFGFNQKNLYQKNIGDLCFADEPNVVRPPSDLPGNPRNYNNYLNLENYFYNLHDNFPKNKGGSCCFVTMSMVLSYYDTYYNDNIIPEIYDKPSELSSSNLNQSPGLLKDSTDTPYPTNGSTNEIISYLYNTKDYLFDCNLMYEHYLNRISDPNWDYKFGLSYLDVHNYLSEFNNQGISCDDYDSYGYRDLLEMMGGNSQSLSLLEQSALIKTNEYKEIIIDYINDGVPVILGVFDSFVLNPNYTGIGNNTNLYKFNGNHSIVAYGIETIDNEEYLLCHFGWENNIYSHIRLNLDLNYYISSYVPVHYNGLHIHHSNNYIIDDLKYCGCGQHIHDLTCHYSDFRYHYYTCPCGYRHYETHSDMINHSCCVDNSSPICPII